MPIGRAFYAAIDTSVLFLFSTNANRIFFSPISPHSPRGYGRHCTCENKRKCKSRAEPGFSVTIKACRDPWDPLWTLRALLYRMPSLHVSRRPVFCAEPSHNPARRVSGANPAGATADCRRRFHLDLLRNSRSRATHRFRETPQYCWNCLWPDMARPISTDQLRARLRRWPRPISFARRERASA